MVSRRTNFGEGSEPAPDRGSKLQSAGGGGGAAQSNVSPLSRVTCSCGTMTSVHRCNIRHSLARLVRIDLCSSIVCVCNCCTCTQGFILKGLPGRF